jgi:predicted DNA-binding transcriptional regulator
MKGLSTIERVILESLDSHNKSLKEIQTETGLSENMTFNLLQALIIRGLVGYESSGYHIGKHIPLEIVKTLNSETSKKLEALELLTSMVESPRDEEFKMRKVYLEGSDEKIFKSLLIQMESLITEASKKNKKNLKDCKVVFWAYDSYGSLIQRMVQEG